MDNRIITQVKQMYLFPSERTQRRHVYRSRRNGHLLRYEKQGNRRETVLRGINNYMIAYWCVVWPTATQAEFNAFFLVTKLQGMNQAHASFILHRLPEQRIG